MQVRPLRRTASNRSSPRPGLPPPSPSVGSRLHAGTAAGSSQLPVPTHTEPTSCDARNQPDARSSLSQHWQAPLPPLPPAPQQQAGGGASAGLQLNQPQQSGAFHQATSSRTGSSRASSGTLDGGIGEGGVGEVPWKEKVGGSDFPKYSTQCCCLRY
jgi:hypothetical protein